MSSLVNVQMTDQKVLQQLVTGLSVAGLQAQLTACVFCCCFGALIYACCSIAR